MRYQGTVKIFYFRVFPTMNPIFILAKTFWHFLPEPIDSEPLV